MTETQPIDDDAPRDGAFMARVREAYAEALGVPADDRDAWIDARRADDPELWTEVQSLLGWSDTSTGAEGTDSSTPDAPHPESIGSYRILGLLGRGGMGVVYRAEQQNPAREVALKIVRPEHASGSILKRFAFEAEVLGRLAHPGIAQIFDAGAVELHGLTTPYLSMELIDGEPLDRWAAHREPHEIIELLAQVCDAVDAAHSASVIHRDLKPGNILVSRDGRPKVLDFGLAAATDSDLLVTSMHTRTGELLGTVPFMSPEQVSGDPSSIDTRTDIYALGVILHKLLVGELPYDVPQHSLLDALRSIRESEPVRLGSVRRDLRGDVETIVLKALEKDKARRYPTAAALAADLRAHLEARPISARPASALYQIRKFTRRNRVLVGGAVTTFLALVAGLIVSINYGLGEAEQRAAAEEARLAVEAANHDLRDVTSFQSNLFRHIDANTMGQDLMAELRRGIGASRAAAGRDTAMVEQELAVFDELVADVAPSEVVQALIADGVIGLASRRVRERSTRPAVAAKLHSGLGRAYADLGQHEQAEAEILRALELLPDDADPLTRLGMQSHLEWVLSRMGRHDEANALYTRVAAEWAQLAPDHREAWELAGSQMVNLVKQGHPEEGAALADEWMARIPEPGAFREHHGMVMGQAAQAYLAAERVDDAERAMIIREQVPDSDLGAREVDAFGTLAYLRESQGRLEEAEVLYRREIAGRTALRGRIHGDVAVGLNNLSYCLLQQGEFAEAATCLVDAIDIARQTLGPHHPDTALFVHTLGEVHLAAGELESAVARLDEAVASYRIARSDHYIAYALSQAAQALVGLGDLDGAFERLEDARHERGFGPELFEGDAFEALRADPRFAEFGD